MLVTTLDDLKTIKEQALTQRAQRLAIAPAATKDSEIRPPTSKEKRIILVRCGVIDPEDIKDYIAEDGYLALTTVLSQMTPRQVIDEVLKSGLRGRGGAGFPAAKKWEFAATQNADSKYMICNADEDPQKESLYLDLLHDENVTGIIFSPTRQFGTRSRARVRNELAIAPLG